MTYSSVRFQLRLPSRLSKTALVQKRARVKLEQRELFDTFLLPLWRAGSVYRRSLGLGDF
jgi:hypothetical protein